MCSEKTTHPASSTKYPDLRREGEVVAAATRIDRDRPALGSHRRAANRPTPIDDASGPGPIRKTSCAYEGQTFFGDFCVNGSGPDAIVSVHHEGRELETKLGHASIEDTAEALLQEMVTRGMIATVVTAGKRGDT